MTQTATATRSAQPQVRFAKPEHHIGIGELHVCAGAGTLVTHALGSCVGVCLFDAASKVAGLIHIMLPASSLSQADAATRPHKFADTGITALRQQMLMHGANPANLRAKYFGGAQMFQAGGDLLAVGKRNILATRKMLWKLKLAVDLEEVGGREARTLHMDVASGRVFVSNGRGGTWV